MPRAWPFFVSLLTACGSSDAPSKAPAPRDAAAQPVLPSAVGAVPEVPAGVRAVPEAAQPPVASRTSAAVGRPAPDFSLRDLSGVSHGLAQYRGKTVVLEWFNPLCPFVEYAHTKGPLADMAKAKTKSGIVWLAINSGAVGKQGHGVEANRDGASSYGMTHPILLDETGDVGRAYAAEKTPHVYLIDPAGTLVYRGGIDNAPFGEVDGAGAYVNYLEGALTALAAGRPVDPAETRAYGCTVKYGAAG